MKINIQENEVTVEGAAPAQPVLANLAEATPHIREADRVYLVPAEAVDTFTTKKVMNVVGHDGALSDVQAKALKDLTHTLVVVTDDEDILQAIALKAIQQGLVVKALFPKRKE